MNEIDEQRSKVEALKKKILEQKRKPGGEDVEVAEKPAPKEAKPAASAKPLEELADERIKQKVEAARKAEEARLEQEKADAKAKQKTEAPKQQSSSPAPAIPPAGMVSQDVVLQAYSEVLKAAWEDGVVSREEETILKILRETLNISEKQHKEFVQEMQLGIYLQALVDGWKNGSITPEDSERLDMLREKFNVSADEHMRLEKQIRKEILRQKS